MNHGLTELQKKQIADAEELFFSGPEKEGFAKELFFGRFREQSMFPYPSLSPMEQETGDKAVAAVRKYCNEHIDAANIDQEALIPDDVIAGLAKVGVLGMTVSPKYGGQGMSQQNYCRVMEVIGGHCASTGVFVNAHHSIGLRALELFGTPDQKEKWMRPLAAGEKLAAFALTEQEAGSDAGNVQTRATPTPDGKGYILNGTKRYITNGGIAGVLSVMARTPDPGSKDGAVTCFLVTPDMQGFEVIEARMPKCGIRGTATAKLAFREMFVPRENILGTTGNGLKLALTVLDFGRITFGASCTGAAKVCLEKALQHAATRRQFGQTLSEFQLVKEKLATMAADTFAMESATYHTAALLDSQAEDFKLETAMLKVFSSDQLWRIVNDALQIHGGAGFFTDQPFERMMRDARLNLIGEGANDVLRSFIAGVGARNMKAFSKEVKENWSKGFSFITPHTPRIYVPHPRMQSASASLSKMVKNFGSTFFKYLVWNGENIINNQLDMARIGDTATELFMASCVYSRLASMFQNSSERRDEREFERKMQTGLFYLKLARERNRVRLQNLKHPLDGDVNNLAERLLS